jgi:predicted HNH restriction endonuclease
LHQPFIIDIKIPTISYALKLVKKYYDEKKSVIDQIGEWPLFYRHERNRDIIESGYDFKEKKPIHILHKESPESVLVIGYNTWSIDISIINGVTKYSQNEHNIIIDDSYEVINNKNQFIEGNILEQETSKYERNKRARDKCINYYGYTCQICGFNFEEKYGEIGREYIEVHHLKPISEIQHEYTVDPIDDLIPICSNCHSIIHRRQPIYSIQELKDKIKEYF